MVKKKQENNEKISELNKEIEKIDKNIKEIISDEEMNKELNSIKDEEIRKKMKKILKDDKENYDKKTKQYLGRFELVTVIDFIDNEDDYDSLGGKINALMDKIETLYWQAGLGHLVEKIKERVIGLFYYLKGEIKEDNTWNLDFRILELIEKNLPNYKSGYPGDISEKQWELIKAKLTFIAKYLLRNYNDCVYNLMKKYSLEWEIDGVKLRYWLISKDEFDKKLKECYEEEKKMEDEFRKLLGEYLFYFWD